MYAKITNGELSQYPYSADELRRANPNTSFGAVLSDDTLAAFGVVRVQALAQPAYDPATESLAELPPGLSGDVWSQQWQVSALSELEIATRKATAGAALQLAVVQATQAALDAFARTRNYDGILSACTYASSSVLRFAAEGQAAVDLRDATWATLYTVMGEVQAGTRPMPASVEAALALLPAMVWPA